jgi:predicted nucleic acid-binding protein
LNEGPVVCNAGPLIALAGVAQLSLLSALYTRILVPEPVIEEIVRSGAGRVGSIEIGSAHWLEELTRDPVRRPTTRRAAAP